MHAGAYASALRERMDFVALVDQVIALRQRGRVTYRTAAAIPVGCGRPGGSPRRAALCSPGGAARRRAGPHLDGRGSPDAPSPRPARGVGSPGPTDVHSAYLAEQILTSRSALEGERKQVTVLFADIKGSTERFAIRSGSRAAVL